MCLQGTYMLEVRRQALKTYPDSTKKMGNLLSNMHTVYIHTNHQARYWDGASDTIPADFDDNEDAWNDQRRRERLAETCYET